MQRAPHSRKADSANRSSQEKTFGGRSAPAIQAFAQTQDQSSSPAQKKENKTGLPDQLKSGVEQLSGFSLDDVKTHYNSDKPKQLKAHAYAQGTDIHVAHGQEKHLPHEAWHVVQQKQGRVQPTIQAKGLPINTDTGLEQEADVMGANASNLNQTGQLNPLNTSAGIPAVIQGNFEDDFIDIKENNPLLTPGMSMMHEGARLAKGGVAGIKAGADVASAPARWASRGIDSTDNSLKKFGYGALGTLGTIASVPLGLAVGGVGAGIGFGTGAVVGGVGLGVTALGGAALGAKEGASAIASGVKNFSLDNARGIYEPTSTHPIYGDRVGRPRSSAVLPPISEPIPIPGAEKRDSVSDFHVGGPVSHGLFGDDPLDSLFSDPFERSRPGQPTALREPLLGHEINTPLEAPKSTAPTSLLTLGIKRRQQAPGGLFSDDPVESGASRSRSTAILPPVSEPIPVPARERRDSDDGFRVGGPVSHGLFGDDLGEPLLSAPFAPSRTQPTTLQAPMSGHQITAPYAPPRLQYPSLRSMTTAEYEATRPLDNPSSLTLDIRRQQQPSGIARAFALGAPAEADNLEAGLSRPRTEGGAMVSRRAPAPSHPLAAARDHGEYNADGSRVNYGKEGKKELAEYGVLASGLAAGAAGKIAYLHGTVSPSAMPSTLPAIEGLGGATGAIGAVTDLIEAGKGVKGATDSAKDAHGRVLSGMQATSALGSATKSSATAAWNINGLVTSSEAVSAGAQAAAGGAAIASGGIDMIRGTYGALRAHNRMQAIAESADSDDAYVRTAVKVAGASQERERTKGVATALRGAASVAGGILLTVSVATPVGWALLGGAAIIGGIAALYNFKKKGETKQKIAAEVLGVANEWQDYNNEVFRIKKVTTFGTQKRKLQLENLEARTPDPLKAKLAEYNFKDAGHFYGNYINYTANYLYTEGVETRPPSADVVAFLGSMGLKVTPPSQPTPEKIAKQLSI